ncbi:MAG: hypothetical protein RL264_2579 [Bacteroidota bacterium]
MKVILVDFYDSFTFNIAHYFELLVDEVEVVRYDKIDFQDLHRSDAIVLSPGPGLPSEKENLKEILSTFAGNKPILGICLGMQALVEFNGGKLYNLGVVRHGVTSLVNARENSVLFDGVPTKFQVGLYHSWGVDVNDKTHVTAVSENNVEMAFEIPAAKIFGVQFHPESILTSHGLKIMENFVNFVKNSNL